MPAIARLHRTVGVRVGTAQQCIELAEAGSEMVRVTVNLPEAAQPTHPTVRKPVVGEIYRFRSRVPASGPKLSITTTTTPAAAISSTF